MNVAITARHCTIPDTIRRRAEERMQQLTRYEPRLARAEVIFDTDREQKRVEARVFVDGGPVTLAHGSADTFRMALDRAADRLRRQLKRRRERRRDHQAVKLSELDGQAEERLLAEEEAEEEASEDAYR